MEYGLVIAIGIVLLVMLTLGCLALGKYITGGNRSNTTGKRGEVFYMMRVDANGNVKIKKHRGNMGMYQKWGNDD